MIMIVNNILIGVVRPRILSFCTVILIDFWPVIVKSYIPDGHNQIGAATLCVYDPTPTRDWSGSGLFAY